MRIVYIGHSGFALVEKDYTVIIDYYKDESNVMPEILADAKYLYVLCSHAHPDHFNPDIFNWSRRDGLTVKYILSKDIKRKLKFVDSIADKDIVIMRKNESYVDKNLSINTFESTDVGISFLLKLEDGKKVFHAGDLNNWKWAYESTEAEMETAERNYLAILDDISSVTTDVDLALFPVDSRMQGDYSIGARQFVHRFKVKNFIPMHFWNRQKKACDFRLYKNECYGMYHCMNEGETLILNI